MAWQNDVVIQGMALNDQGFTVDGALAGIGLNTFGFLWPCSGIWIPADPVVTTNWGSCSIANVTLDPNGICIE